MKTYITKKKHKELLKKLEQMQKDYRTFATTELAEAVDLGDIRENSEYDSAVWKQNHMAAMISELKFALSQSIVYIDDLRLNLTRVSIGTVVTIQDHDSRQIEIYTILGPHESDFDQGIISYLSPFAKLLIHKKVSDKIRIDDNHSYQIIDIKGAEFS